MGQREIKRVPLGFNHPLERVWPGYLPPSPRDCPEGDGCVNGSTADRAWLEDWTTVLMLAATSPDHPWVRDAPLAERPPSGALTELTVALAGRTPTRLGHDAMDRWAATKAILRGAGLGEDWGQCPGCGGLAYHPDDAQLLDEWTPTDPPHGDGWQLWETTSEGSPVSPVFATPAELATWAEDGATLFATRRATAAEWLRWIMEDEVVTASTIAMGFTVTA